MPAGLPRVPLTPVATGVPGRDLSEPLNVVGVLLPQRPRVTERNLLYTREVPFPLFFKLPSSLWVKF